MRIFGISETVKYAEGGEVKQPTQISWNIKYVRLQLLRAGITGNQLPVIIRTGNREGITKAESRFQTGTSVARIYFIICSRQSDSQMGVYVQS